MSLNKSIVDMYIQKSAKTATSNHKTPSSAKPESKMDNNNIINKPEKPSEINDEVHSLKRSKLDETLASISSKSKLTFEFLFGCDQAKDQILKIINRFQRSLKDLSRRSDWPIIIYGSHGLGKTSLVEAASNYAKLELVTIPLRTFAEQSRNEFKTTLNMITKHCISNQPAIVLFDDLEEVSDKEDFRNIIRSSIRRLLSDESNLLVICTTSSIIETSFGIDFLLGIQLKRPDFEARYKILKNLCDQNKNLQNLKEAELKEITINTPSFTPLDLRKMLDIAETESTSSPNLANCNTAIDIIKQSIKKGTNLIGERPTITWDDVGGLPEVRSAFLDIIRGVRKGNVNCKFAGIALYGPPGCGKTMVAQAMANEAGLNFISIKPAELVDKFLGETEKNIRRVFREAQEHEPCMIYFDEFDGLCGTRGNKDTVASAIQTLLSEMDGFVSRGKSIILASTNRIEDIDPAMKRPGRLSKHIYVGPPNTAARLQILKIIAKRPLISLSRDVNLKYWAENTKNFSGADLDFLMSEAEAKALSEAYQVNQEVASIVIRTSHIEHAMKTIRATNMELKKKMSWRDSNTELHVCGDDDYDCEMNVAL